MRGNWKSWIAIAFAMMHLALVMAYSFPDRMVPEKLRVIAQLYARPLFHQQWKLFAPDPPLCSCEIEWSIDRTEWRSIGAKHYLEERIAQTLARHAQASLRSEVNDVDPLLIEAMRNAIGLKEGRIAYFRLKERCVTNARSSADRELRIIPIGS